MEVPLRRLVVMTVSCLMIVFAAGVGEVFALTISGPFNFTDTRSPNLFGFGTIPRITFGADITPSDPPTTATGTQGSTTITLIRDVDIGFPISFDLDDFFGRDFSLSLTGSWSISATRGLETAGPVLTNPIPNPQLLPFVQNLQVLGTGLTPTLAWTLPDLTGFTVNRIRVEAADVTTPGIFERFFRASLGPTATSFTIPPGVLQLGRSYGFVIRLDDLETLPGFGTFVANTSRTFTPQPFSPGTLVAITGTDGVPRAPAGGGVDLAGTYSDVTIAPGATVTVTRGPSLNTLTLSNATIMNNNPVAPATLSIGYSSTLSPVDTSVPRFYATSLSGGFARGFFELATGDSITLNAFVDYQSSVGGTTRSGIIDPNKTFDVTMANNNGFAPQTPPQGSASFLCSDVVGAPCALQETLRSQLSIVLGPGDTLNVLGSLTILSAADPASLNQALADLARIPALISVAGSGVTFPETPTYWATLALDVQGSSSALPSGSVRYFYTRTRMDFASTALTSVSAAGKTVTVTGTGTVNGVPGFGFMATLVKDAGVGGDTDLFGIQILQPDGTLFFNASPKPITTGNIGVTAQ